MLAHGLEHDWREPNYRISMALITAAATTILIRPASTKQIAAPRTAGGSSCGRTGVRWRIQCLGDVFSGQVKFEAAQPGYAAACRPRRAGERQAIDENLLLEKFTKTRFRRNSEQSRLAARHEHECGHPRRHPRHATSPDAPAKSTGINKPFSSAHWRLLVPKPDDSTMPLRRRKKPAPWPASVAKPLCSKKIRNCSNFTARTNRSGSEESAPGQR